MKHNPFHEEAVKAARMVGVDFLLNVVKSSRGDIVQAVAGDLEAAHERGVATCHETWRVTLPGQYDITIVTPGGYPRDINLHQAQKALSAAEMVTKEGGVIVLVAQCAEGAGPFTGWLREAQSPRQVIDRFRCEGFTREQSSKAFMCARALDKYHVILCSSDLRGEALEQMFFHYSPFPQSAVDEALAIKGKKARVLVLPYAACCIPVLP
jgi:nickel-dependent lactate racemase